MSLIFGSEIEFELLSEVDVKSCLPSVCVCVRTIISRHCTKSLTYNGSMYKVPPYDDAEVLGTQEKLGFDF